MVMSRVIIGKWGRNLAIRVPSHVARACGLRSGERIEVEAQDGAIVIRRPAAHARMQHDAETAAAEIIGESQRHSLGGVSGRDLLDEGRRG
jgi:antitoxin MazE